MLNRYNELENRPPIDNQTAEGQKFIQDLQNRCAELEKRPSETQVAEGLKMIQDSRTRCDELENEKRSIETQVAEARKIAQELQNRCNELEKRPTETQAAKAQDTIKALQRRCDELETQSIEAKGCALPSTQAALIELQDRCNELELRPTDAELLGTQSALTTLQDRYNELEKRPVEAEAQLLTLHADNKRLRKERLQPINKGGNEVLSLRRTLRNEQDLKKEALKKQYALEADLVAARSALKESEAREKAAVDLHSTTDVELLDAQWELSDQQEKIKELEKKLQDKSAPEANGELEGKIRKLEEQLQEHSAQEATLSAVRIDLANLQTRFKKLEKEHAGTDQANRQLTKSSKTMQDSLVARDSEVQELHSKNKTQKEQLIKAERDLKANHQKATVDEAHIKSQDEAVSRLNKEVSQLKGRYEKLDRVANDSKKKSSELETKLSLLKKENKEIEKENASLRTDLHERRLAVVKRNQVREQLEKDFFDLNEDHDRLKQEKADSESLSRKVGDEYKKLEKDHRRVCNSLKTLQIVHAKCLTEAPNRSEQGLHAPTSQPLKPSAEDTKDLVPRSIEGEKQLDDGESFGDNASQAMNETPLEDQLRWASPDIAQGVFGGGSVSEAAVSQDEDWADHVPRETGGTATPGPKGGDNPSTPTACGKASPGAMGGDGPSAPANGGTLVPGPKGGQNSKAPASGGGNGPPKTPPRSGISRPTPQKLQVCLLEAVISW